jgi:hypothetical protein
MVAMEPLLTLSNTASNKADLMDNNRVHQILMVRLLVNILHRDLRLDIIRAQVHLSLTVVLSNKSNNRAGDYSLN